MELSRIVIASGNKNKIAEMQAVIRDYLGKACPPINTLWDAPFVKMPPETGTTFAENARLKAETVAFQTNQPALGDDSGLRVLSLEGELGVNTSTFAGPQATDAQNRAKLLERMKAMKGDQRRAQMVCSLCLIVPQQLKPVKVLMVEAHVEGVIAESEKGNQGFGYDSIFYLPDLKKTFAECTPQEKNSLSHRGMALRKLLAEMNMVSYKVSQVGMG